MKTTQTTRNTHITAHAYERLRKRNGWEKKTCDRMIEKIFEVGTRSADIKGYLKSYVVKKTAEAAIEDEIEMIYYGDVLYVFGRNNTLVTTYPAPTRNSFQRKWDGVKHNANRRTKSYNARVAEGKVYGAARRTREEERAKSRAAKENLHFNLDGLAMIG